MSLLVERLESRRPEIEQTILARVFSLSNGPGSDDPEYVTGLRMAVSAAVDYGLAGIERKTIPIPSTLLAQARLAARNDVGLDTVLRRYFAGYTLLGEFIMKEAEADDETSGERLQRLSRAQAALFERLVAAVSDEYMHGADGRLHSVGHARAVRVKELLEGKMVDAPELGYELNAWHLGMVATGPGASGAIREMASGLGGRTLVVRPDAGVVWGWLGGRSKIAFDDLACQASSAPAEEMALSVGEPAHGISGWRLTHRQAQAALPIAMRRSQGVVRYSDVALLSSVLRDDVLAASLRDIYLAPLETERDGGAALRETLHAYFAAGRNASSAAARLGISRQTVSVRLRTVEERIGRPLDTCVAETEVALRLHDLSESSQPPQC